MVIVYWLLERISKLKKDLADSVSSCNIINKAYVNTIQLLKDERAKYTGYSLHISNLEKKLDKLKQRLAKQKKSNEN